ncbi:MAG: DUF2779 domain-containing protein [Candidatus Woesebacteria bacterium]|nr:DUF2779 domain-containing protein [Candidatus Woesebacteria bacterium]
MLTKSDFLLYLEAPVHLWAKKHIQSYKEILSEYERFLMEQGKEVEKLARNLLPSAEWQKTFRVGEFETRADALLKNADGTYDLYEVKSITNIEKEHIYDVIFQSIVIGKNIQLNRIFLVTLNKEYILEDTLNINTLFVKNDVTNKVRELTSETESKMAEALKVTNSKSTNYIENCLKPKDCPCLDLCYPNLPEKSIFDIPLLSPKKKRTLVDSKIFEIKDIPLSFELSPKQKLIAGVIRSDLPHLNKQNLQEFLNTFIYPLYFLDYETYSLAVPIHKGYKPYQHMVFQYSLHIIDRDKNIEHKEYLEIEDREPSKKLLEKLKNDIGNTGTVIVWNSTFESERNRDMATLCPKHKEFLDNINSRIVDLADFIKKEYYIHPGFLGSWSIKNVLPVMVPELSYKNLKVNKGDVAMIAWWELIHSEDKSVAKDLLEYCGLDSLAMVEIWRKLNNLLVN